MENPKTNKLRQKNINPELQAGLTWACLPVGLSYGLCGRESASIVKEAKC